MTEGLAADGGLEIADEGFLLGHLAGRGGPDEQLEEIEWFRHAPAQLRAKDFVVVNLVRRRMTPHSSRLGSRCCGQPAAH